MNIKNFLILLFVIALLILNYFMFNEIMSDKKEKIYKTVIEINNTKTIATSKNNNSDKTNTKIEINENVQNNKFKKSSKPLLAIIIDDISFSWHLRLISTVNLPLNMSFLPPTSRHPKSHLLASDYDKYMVHLPLEAKNYYASETGTLRINSDYESIDKKIKLIRSLFPNAKYINNHTGSKFTSNLNAMKNLSLALEKYNFIFLDSKTIADSKSKIAFNYKVLTRDTFLDNVDDIAYIKKQIIEAVEHSIRKGYAIAIGHPRKNTLKAIKQMEKYISRYTKVVYIDELHNKISNK